MYLITAGRSLVYLFKFWASFWVTYVAGLLLTTEHPFFFSSCLLLPLPFHRLLLFCFTYCSHLPPDFSIPSSCWRRQRNAPWLWRICWQNLQEPLVVAPFCGGCMIDWTKGKRCQVGLHDWISCLIINSPLFLPSTARRHIMRHISMRHVALDYYSHSALPHFYFLLDKQAHRSTATTFCVQYAD